MAEYRAPDGHVVERRSGAGRMIAIVVGILALIAVVLFATGFWSADVKEGALPDVDVSAKGGEMPAVDLDSKAVVVGTKKTEVEVPVVGVKDNGEKISAEQKTDVDNALSELKQALEGEDVSAINAAVDRLNTVMQAAAAALYANAQAEPTADAAGADNADEDIVEGEVIDEDTK